ncbi:uncharacterized protein F5891DRAFT_981121 [Suillus fuscotomentosus]|uniref:Uncharacterized protein n=1 Tax=Suillus fuscotomentosus TaxID=1912939 RepID=A0AAD4E4E1_9AGAM|nr:uncharacterized protein F5891DRAFT_981121 [Suillus fuscotomentosus]KAG1899345.1 hypothetical protein F5891DRAFT_981121 [Suillus fuscotomentosus]
MPGPDHQSAIVEFLIDSTVFPPRFVFNTNPDTEESHFLENAVVWDIVINAVVELGFMPHLEELDKLFCAAVAAVKCALMELRSGRFVEMEFTCQAFGDIPILNRKIASITLQIEQERGDPQLKARRRWDVGVETSTRPDGLNPSVGGSEEILSSRPEGRYRPM